MWAGNAPFRKQLCGDFDEDTQGPWKTQCWMFKSTPRRKNVNAAFRFGLDPPCCCYLVQLLLLVLYLVLEFPISCRGVCWFLISGTDGFCWTTQEGCLVGEQMPCEVSSTVMAFVCIISRWRCSLLLTAEFPYHGKAAQTGKWCSLIQLFFQAGAKQWNRKDFYRGWRVSSLVSLKHKNPYS